MKPICVYHGGCVDGITAAWVVGEASIQRTNEYPEFFAAKHGELPEPEQFFGRDVIFVDFAWPEPTMRAIAVGCHSMLVFDHHKTTIEHLGVAETTEPCESTAWPGRCKFWLDTSCSGAGLAWIYYGLEGFQWEDDWMGANEVEELIDHVQDRDLWIFEYDDSKAVFAAMTSYQLDDPVAWGGVMIRGVGELAVEGAALERYRSAMVESLCSKAHSCVIDGVLIPMANAPYQVGSDVAARLLELYPKAPYAGYWFRDGDVMQYGLRSTDDRTDVAEVAESFGGGGHRNASGFRIGDAAHPSRAWGRFESWAQISLDILR